MREDMRHVLIDRPRFKSWRGKKGLQKKTRDIEDMPNWEASGRHRRFGWAAKDLNDFLAPLRRFLVGAVGRPWSDVEAEVRQRLSSKSYMEAHVLGHFYSYVDVDGHKPEYAKGALYVDDDGVLRLRPGYNNKLKSIRRKNELKPIKLDDSYIIEFKGVLYATKHDMMKQRFHTGFLDGSKLLDARGVLIMDHVGDEITARLIPKTFHGKTKYYEWGSKCRTVRMGVVSWWNTLEKRVLSSDERRRLNI